MKKILFVGVCMYLFWSCQKVEESVHDLKNHAQKKTEEVVQKTVEEYFSKATGAESVQYIQVFPHAIDLKNEQEIGKKILLPHGMVIYFFRFKNSNKDLLLSTLLAQPVVDETQSSGKYQKMSADFFLTKMETIRQFIPSNILDLSFLDEIKNNKSIEYYRIKRFPNFSTVIFNPKNHQVYQFVEVKK